MHQNCPLVTRITFSYRFWCCDSRTAQICPMSHSSFPWSYSQKQSRLWSMFYAISGSRTSTLSSAAPTSAFPLASWHPHILPGWHLCIASVCSSEWWWKLVCKTYSNIARIQPPFRLCEDHSSYAIRVRGDSIGSKRKTRQWFAAAFLSVQPTLLPLIMNTWQILWQT